MCCLLLAGCNQRSLTVTMHFCNQLFLPNHSTEFFKADFNNLLWGFVLHLLCFFLNQFFSFCNNFSLRKCRNGSHLGDYSHDSTLIHYYATEENVTYLLILTLTWLKYIVCKFMYSETCLHQTTIGFRRNVQFRQVFSLGRLKTNENFYKGIYKGNQSGSDRFLVFSGFSLDRFHCI